MADLPEYLTDQTTEAIRGRMLDALPVGLDRAEGGFAWDTLSPAALELAQAADWAQGVLERVFASTSFGAYLDLRAEEHGVTRRAAVKATGTVRFTGAQGATVPAGTVVSTLSNEATPAITFVTDQEAVIGAGGSVDVAVTAQQAGAEGNVAADTIVRLGTAVAGVSAVTNPSATTGGLDEESDADLLARYLQRVRNPAAGGNKGDYVSWALEVAGVGGAVCIPVEDGPGTVSVYVIDTDKLPAGNALVEDVQDYIAPPLSSLHEQTDLTYTEGLNGVTTDNAVADAFDGIAVKLVYDAGGQGVVDHQNVQNVLSQPGIWNARPHVKVDSNVEAADLLQVGVWNVTAGAWAKTTPGGATDAVATYRAQDLGMAFHPQGSEDPIADSRNWPVQVQFYWNGVDTVELWVRRLQTDTTTVVWLDHVAYVSTFSAADGAGKAPIGARVSVRPAEAVTISVSATLTVATGYDRSTVEAAVEAAITEYLASIAFASQNDVRYAKVGSAILDTDGVSDYADLLVNGGTANVTVAEGQVAVLGTVTWA